MGVVDQALKALDQIAKDLPAEYARPAHQGRIEQITAHLAGLRSLISELPHEEMREADYAARLTDLYDSGRWVAHEHSSDAHPRLMHALEARKAGAA
jgi:hypothetical protein